MNIVYKNWTKSGNGTLNLDNPGKSIKFCTGDEGGDAYEDEEVVIVDDDRWQFSQTVGMHLGYFWCLSEFHDLTDDCRQHCEKVGMTMDNIRSTSPVPGSGSSSSKKKK